MTEALAEYHAGLLAQESVTRLKSLPSPDAVVAAFLLFASNDSDYISGQVLVRTAACWLSAGGNLPD